MSNLIALAVRRAIRTACGNYVGHELPTALMASFVTATLGAPAAALGLIEGISDGLAGAGRFVGGALAETPADGAPSLSAATRPPRSSPL